MRKRKKHRGITPKKDHRGPYYLVRVTRRDPRTGEELEQRRKVRDTLPVALAVKEEVARLLEAQIAGEVSPHMTLTDFVRPWLAQRATWVSSSTLKKYMNDLEKHILPNLGHRVISEIRPSEVRALMSRDRGADNSRKNRLGLLRAIAKDALADGIIDRDFCLRVSVEVAEVYTEEEPNSLSPEQLGTLLDCFSDEWLDALYLFAFTGMRWCEVAGLQWRDIDLDRGILRIRRSNVKGEIGGPKTRKSRRTLGLTAEVTARLRARYQRMQAAKHPGLRKGWVFPKSNGEHHAGYPFRKALIAACVTAGIQIRFTTHGLRRTYNNLARRLGDLLVLRAVVGHTTDQMSEHYSHIGIEEKRALSEKVADEVRNRHSDRHSGSPEDPGTDPKTE